MRATVSRILEFTKLYCLVRTAADALAVAACAWTAAAAACSCPTTSIIDKAQIAGITAWILFLQDQNTRRLTTPAAVMVMPGDGTCTGSGDCTGLPAQASSTACNNAGTCTWAADTIIRPHIFCGRHERLHVTAEGDPGEVAVWSSDLTCTPCLPAEKH